MTSTARAAVHIATPQVPPPLLSVKLAEDLMLLVHMSFVNPKAQEVLKAYPINTQCTQAFPGCPLCLPFHGWHCC